ncbi:MAG TPA: metallophosphoesterase [Verrucomicrobiae bacterium]
MKILFVADLHYALKQFDWLVANATNFDAVIIGGDLLDLASNLDLDVQIIVVEKYLQRIRQNTCLLVSSGNHDGDSRSAADESVARWIYESKAEGLFVDGDSLELSDTRITICPWWDGPVSRAELEKQLTDQSQKTRGRWIWVHHAPPAGSPVCWTGKKSAGDEALLEWIKRFQPDMVLSGHIHNSPFYSEGAWVDRIGKTWVFNPGKQIGPSPTHIALDLEAMTAEWISIEGQSLRKLAVTNG